MDKPLHVQVAEALGLDTDSNNHRWDEAPEGSAGCTRCGAWVSWASATTDNGASEASLCARSYDTDWSATGPLIEKYGIALIPHSGGWTANYRFMADGFMAHAELAYKAPEALVAVCDLIIALKAAGKLQEPALLSR